MSRNLTTDLAFLSISITELSEELDYNEFRTVMEYLTRAKYHDNLKEYLDDVQKIYGQGTDPVSAFDHAYFDRFLNPDKNL
jgi:hypothetical protein